MARPRPHRPAVSTRAAVAVSLTLHATVLGLALASGWPAGPGRPPQAGVRSWSITWAPPAAAAPLRITARLAPTDPPAPPPPAQLPDLLPDPVRGGEAWTRPAESPSASVLASVRAVRPRPTSAADAPAADAAEPPRDGAATDGAGRAAASRGSPESRVASPGAGSGAEAGASPPSSPAGAVVAPEPREDNEPPRYPGASRRRGEQGLVVVRAVVDATGAVREAVVIGSSGHARLDEAARRAVSGWRFAPARRDGVAVEHPIEVPIRFALDEG